MYKVGDRIILSTANRRKEYAPPGSDRVTNFSPRHDGPYEITAAHPQTSTYELRILECAWSLTHFYKQPEHRPLCCPRIVHASIPWHTCLIRSLQSLWQAALHDNAAAVGISLRQKGSQAIHLAISAMLKHACSIVHRWGSEKPTSIMIVSGSHRWFRSPQSDNGSNSKTPSDHVVIFCNHS